MQIVLKLNEVKIQSYSYILFILYSVFSFSCKTDHSNTEFSENVLITDSLDYARGFSIQKKNDYTLVTIKNPWQGAENIEYKFVLVKDGEKVPSLNDNIKVIRTPVKKVICLSTTHIAFIDVLEETSSIVAVSGKNYVNNPKIEERIKKNDIYDVGYDNSLNYELITSLEPDLVITYGVGGHVAGYNQKLNDLGINTLIIAEYLENDPLGKLEWIKLMGELYNKREDANEYFDRVKAAYNKLRGLTEDVKKKPKVLFGLPWKDTWHVPGGNSYLAKMVEDAGGDYIWKNNPSRESLPFDIESIFAKASDATVWLNTGTANSKNDIVKVDERFKQFRPFQQSAIYNNNLRMNKFGGIDYWETGLVEPNIILKDMIKIFHPDLLPEHKLVYYKIIE